MSNLGLLPLRSGIPDHLSSLLTSAWGTLNSIQQIEPEDPVLDGSTRSAIYILLHGSCQDL